MRILFITGSFPPMRCGIGDYTERLAGTLAAREGTDVAILTDVQAAASSNNTVMKVFPVVRGWGFSDIPRIVKATQGWHPDIVHFQYPTQGYGDKILPWLLPPIIGFLGIPVVQTWHEYYPLKGWFNLPNAIMPGGLIAVRPGYMENMPAWFRWLIRKKQFRYIPNASTIPVVPLSDDGKIGIRSRYIEASESLIVYFGFVYPAKGVELLFDIADPERHKLVLICELNPSDAYHNLIRDRARNEPWANNVTITGYLPKEEAGRLLSAADAVVFPFREGGGTWNTSIHGAVAQGTFVLTTSRERHGYDSDKNVYFAHPGDVADMRRALHLHSGRKCAQASITHDYTWDDIADSHIRLYGALQG